MELIQALLQRLEQRKRDIELIIYTDCEQELAKLHLTISEKMQSASDWKDIKGNDFKSHFEYAKKREKELVHLRRKQQLHGGYLVMELEAVGRDIDLLKQELTRLRYPGIELAS